MAAKRLEVPTYAEGFDHLYRIRLVGQSDYELAALPPQAMVGFLEQLETSH